MKVASFILIAIVLVELVAAAVYFRQQATTTVPLIPDEQLADPSIVPQLEALAEAAQSGDANDWSRFGQGLLGKGFYAHAELAFQQSLRHDPQQFDALFGLAFCLDRTGRMQESNVAYGNVVQAAAQTQEEQAMQIYALYAMGRNALRLEDYDQAYDLFRQNADYPAAEYQQAKLLVRAGDAEQALPLIQKNLTKIPYSLGFHFLDQRAQEVLQNERAAYMAKAMVERSAYLVSLNFSTDYVSPLNAQTGIDTQISELLTAMDEEDWSAAEAISKEVFEAIGDSRVFNAKPAVDAMLQLSLRNQKPQETLDQVAKLKSKGRVDAITLEAAGDAYNLLNDPTRAVEYWQRAARLTPSITLHEKLAEHTSKGDDFHRSQVAFLKGLEHYRRNRLRAAIPEFEQAIKLDSKSAMAWYYLGEMNFYLDEPGAAIAAYQQCLRLDPDHGRAADKLAFLNSER